MSQNVVNGTSQKAFGHSMPVFSYFCRAPGQKLVKTQSPSPQIGQDEDSQMIVDWMFETDCFWPLLVFTPPLNKNSFLWNSPFFSFSRRVGACLCMHQHFQFFAFRKTGGTLRLSKVKECCVVCSKGEMSFIFPFMHWILIDCLNV